MRLFKISQIITFKEDAFLGVFKKGQDVTFTGYITCYNEIITGYMKQEPVDDGNSLTLYVKGHQEIRFGKELVLVQTTKSNSNSPITLCSYFPCVHNNEGIGYVDDTDGKPSKDGKYFFICGNFIAETYIQIEEIAMLVSIGEPNTEYEKAEKKINRMLNKLYSAKKQGSLNFGFLFDYIKPHWVGAHWNLLHTYPNKSTK